MAKHFSHKNISAEAIADALLTVEGWFEYYNKPEEAKKANELFEVVWKMLDEELPEPLKNQTNERKALDTRARQNHA